MKKLNNNRGVTLLYLVMSLLIIGFLSTALTKLIHFEANSSSDYGAVQNAYIAANSAIEQTEYLIKTYSDSAAKFLTDFIRGNNNGWYIGDSLNYYTVPGSNTQIKAKIISFDYDKMCIEVEGIGKSKAKSKKKIRSIIYLDGIDWNKSLDTVYSESPFPVHALRLGSGADELDCPLHIYGDTYVRGGGHMYGGPTQFSVFEGKFRVGKGSGAFEVKFGEFKEEFYCEADSITFWDLPTSIFRKGLGCEGKVGFNNSLRVHGNAYFNGPVKLLKWSSNDGIDMNWHKIYGLNPSSKYRNNSSSTGLNAIAKHYSAAILKNDSLDIKDSLGFADTVPKVKVNIALLKPYAINANLGYATNNPLGLKVNLDGEDMNKLYDSIKTANPSMLYQDKWLVLNFKGSNGTPFKSGGDGFHGKAVWIIENTTLQAANQFYEHNDSGITFIYVGTGGKINPGIGGMNLFRGFIYLDAPGSGTDIFKGKNGTLFKGGIYVTENSKKFRLEGFGPFTVKYDADVLKEIAATNIFSDTTVISKIDTIKVDSLILTAPYITPIKKSIYN